jgi:hypothetical protein
MPSHVWGGVGAQLGRLSRVVGSTPGSAVGPRVLVERLAWWAESGWPGGVHQQHDCGWLHDAMRAWQLREPFRGCGRPQRLQGGARSHGLGGGRGVRAAADWKRPWSPIGVVWYVQTLVGMTGVSSVWRRTFQMQRMPEAVISGGEGRVRGCHLCRALLRYCSQDRRDSKMWRRIRGGALSRGWNCLLRCCCRA